MVPFPRYENINVMFARDGSSLSDFFRSWYNHGFKSAESFLNMTSYYMITGTNTCFETHDSVSVSQQSKTHHKQIGRGGQVFFVGRPWEASCSKCMGSLARELLLELPIVKKMDITNNFFQTSTVAFILPKNTGVPYQHSSSTLLGICAFNYF